MKDLSSANVLIVDEDSSTVRVLKWALKKNGVGSIQSHSNALRALTYMIGDDASVDLILCDLSIPHMDGVEFFRRLAEIGYRGGIVVVSNEDARVMDMVKKLARVQKLNFLGCLEKPVRPNAVQSLMKQWLKHEPLIHHPAGAPVTADEIRDAIANRELVNFYQPKVEVTTGTVVGVESLVRWLRPKVGIIAPGRFITVAETHGLIEQITRYVTGEALTHKRAWQEAGVTVSVAINVSMDDLAELDFPEFLAFETARAGVLPSSIVLEVTESRLMKDPMAVLDVLTRLRLKRFRLSLDDFGTGYSSLAQLRDISFDELKVDLSFVHGAQRDPKMQAIVEGSQRIAQQLGMTVVAEGVEDRDDWDFIRGAHCDLAQGYFIAKPMPHEELLGWLDDWHRRVPDLITRTDRSCRK
ncbi:MAG: EAL domain-containing response regulator [Candidatus Binatia bacterium]